MQRRSIRLINPRLQHRMVGAFVGLAVLAMLLQFLFLGARLTHVASTIPDGGAELATEVPLVLVKVLLVSLIALIPIIYAFGVRITFKLAGPIYRFESFLRAVSEGTQVEECRIRRKDQLHDLCRQINEATAMARAQNAERARADEAAEGSEDSSLAA